MEFKCVEGATPLNQDETYNLLAKHLTTQKELDEWEQWNILQAEQWAFQYKRQDILTIRFAKALHKKMFDQTWKWAGQFRTTQTNIGVPSTNITGHLLYLLDDVIYQLEHQTYPIREIAARLHHRLVYVHPYPNGNGRFARLFVDVLLINYKQRRFTWGKDNLAQIGETRKQYLEALKAADMSDYKKLFAFLDM